MSSIYSKLITFILEHEGDNWFSAREFAEKYSFNYHSVRRYLLELAETGYLETRREGRQTFYKLKNPHQLAELERELARKDMIRAQAEEIKKLREEIKKLRFLLSQYNNLIDEETLRKTPEEPIIQVSEEKPKDTIEVIMDLLYQKYCTSNIIKVKSPKKGKQTVGDIIT